MHVLYLTEYLYTVELLLLQKYDAHGDTRTPTPIHPTPNASF